MEITKVYNLIILDKLVRWKILETLQFKVLTKQ